MWSDQKFALGGDKFLGCFDAPRRAFLAKTGWVYSDKCKGVHLNNYLLRAYTVLLLFLQGRFVVLGRHKIHIVIPQDFEIGAF
jgi:hypothetical protein